MLQLTLNSQEYLFVPVPEDARDFNVLKQDLYDKIVFSSNIQDPLNCGGDMIILPSDSWSIVGTTAEVLQSEELAKEIVEKECDGYSPISGTYPSGCYDYVKKEFYSRFPAKSSFRTLLQHHNIPHSIILQKQ